MPFANNQQKSRDLFFNRKEYLNFSLSQTIDTFKKEKLLVGKIDLNQDPIVPKETRLVKIENVYEDSKNIKALDFVADAFVAMTQKFKQNLTENKIVFKRNYQGNFEDQLTDLKCRKGYTNFLQDYSFYITGIFAGHLEYLKSSEPEQRKVLNFNDFVNHFHSYLELNQIEFLLASEYYRSFNNDRSTSGLVLDIDSGDCSDDGYKYTKFHQNPNYPYFNRLANAFGFYFDKHVPWRLVADINSPQMKYYIMSRNAYLTNTASFSTDTFINLYFKTYTDDYEQFMKYLTKSYNNLVRYRSNVRYFIETKCSMQSIIGKRYEVPEINLFNSLPLNTHKILIKSYINIKNKNSRLNYNDLEISKIYKYSISLFNKSRYESLSYIDNKFNNLNHFEGTINFNNVNDSYILSNSDRNASKDIANYIKIRKMKDL